MNVRHWAILILSKWVSDYNRYDEAYQWWWHVVWTWRVEELKVYNLYYSIKLCSGKMHIYIIDQLFWRCRAPWCWGFCGLERGITISLQQIWASSTYALQQFHHCPTILDLSFLDNNSLTMKRSKKAREIWEKGIHKERTHEMCWKVH